VAVNCAALTESLLEAELFGHAKGAFTGASGARAGLIEHAEGGTVFLDEIGTLSKGLQAKLLRALESGEVRRVGENDSRTVDVRFVAATNIDLKAATAAGDFRSDLYYRLDVHAVHMPALRERSDDIPQLVEHFVARYGTAAGVTACAPAAMAILVAYSYPGNVRQLEHLVQRAVANARSSELTLDDLPEELLAEPAMAAPPEGTVAAAREKAEREMVVATLSKHGGEIGATARELQVSRTTMWRLMKKHGIE
jgi:two-component system response regulator HydG